MNYLVGIFKAVLYLGAVSSVLILIILLTKSIFKKAISPKWHYYIWVLLIIRLLVPYTPESSFSVFNLFYTAAEKINIPVNGINNLLQEPTPEVFSGGASGIIAPDLQASTGNQVNGNENTKESGTTPQNPGKDGGNVKAAGRFGLPMVLLSVTWLMIVMFLTLYIIYINMVFAVKVKKNYIPLKDKRINDILLDCKSRMKINRPIGLLTTDQMRAPSLYVFFKPEILVSKAYLNQLSDTEIEYIFLHELSHYKRKDIAVNWILALLQIIYFFHPLIWYAFHKIHEDCEISCDAKALSYIREEEYQSYGSTIIKLIRFFSESNFIPVTAGIGKNKSSYKRRIIMISKFKKSKWTSTLLAFVIIITVALAGLTGCKKSPEVIDTADLTDTSNSTEDQDTMDNANSTQDRDTTDNANSAENQDATDNTASGGEETRDINEENNTGVQDAVGTVIRESGDKNTAGPAEGAGNIPNVAENNPTPRDANPRLTPAASESRETYYGDWVINKVLAYGSAGTYSKEDAEKLVGKSLSFTADQATFFGDDPSYIDETASNPAYTRTDVSGREFTAGYRMTFENLGIDADSVPKINVSEGDKTVCDFLVKDDDTLVLIGGGTYFELVRK